MYVMVGLVSAVIPVVAVLRVLLNAGVGVSDEADYAFSKDVFANYIHSLLHQDAITLQTKLLHRRSTHMGVWCHRECTARAEEAWREQHDQSDNKK